jgi:hypothetical protein
LALQVDRQRQTLLQRLRQPLVRGVPGRVERTAQGKQFAGLQAADGLFTQWQLNLSTLHGFILAHR